MGPGPRPPGRKQLDRRRAPRTCTTTVRCPPRKVGAQAGRDRPAAMRYDRILRPPPREAVPISINPRTDRDRTGGSRREAPGRLRLSTDRGHRGPVSPIGHRSEWLPRGGATAPANARRSPRPEGQASTSGPSDRRASRGPGISGPRPHHPASDPRAALVGTPSGAPCPRRLRSNCVHSSNRERLMQRNRGFSTNIISIQSRSTPSRARIGPDPCPEMRKLNTMIPAPAASPAVFGWMGSPPATAAGLRSGVCRSPHADGSWASSAGRSS